MFDKDEETIERWGAEAHDQGVPRDCSVVAGRWLADWQRGWDKAKARKVAYQMGINDRRAGVSHMPVFDTEGERSAWQRGWDERDAQAKAGNAPDWPVKDAPMSHTHARATPTADDLADQFQRFAVVGGGCNGCQFASTSEDEGDDPDERHFACALLGERVWGEDTPCTPNDWYRRAMTDALALTAASRRVWDQMNSGQMISEADFAALDQALAVFEEPTDWRAAQEAFILAALDAGIDQIGEADEPRDYALESSPYGDEEPVKVVSLRPAPPNVRPVTSGSLMDPEMLDALITSSGLAEPDHTDQVPALKRPVHGGYPGRLAPRLAVVQDEPVFALKTGDPAFNPAAPVTVNGYLFNPASRPSGVSN